MPHIINLPKFEDPRGNLSFVEEFKHIPFKIERTYWIYDVPGGQVRGGHAFKTQHEFIIALSGSFDVIVKDGNQEMRYHLNRSYYGLYIEAGLWRQMENFSTNAVAMVLSSTHYSPDDYIYDYIEFLKWRGINGKD
jgi:dTDP-4-dehydrorhamnose 3,5-epimerase-like enzyme